MYQGVWPRRTIQENPLIHYLHWVSPFLSGLPRALNMIREGAQGSPILHGVRTFQGFVLFPSISLSPWLFLTRLQDEKRGRSDLAY